MDFLIPESLLVPSIVIVVSFIFVASIIAAYDAGHAAAHRLINRQIARAQSKETPR